MTPVPTKLQVASIASILLLIEVAACTIAQAAVEGGFNGAARAAALVAFACSNITNFLPKLGLLRSRFHYICDWAGFSLGAAIFLFLGISSYQESNFIMMALGGIFFSIGCFR